ncbi:MAG: hypothetical protein U9N35_03420 [Euryarchaeota archaeon]|nr:hypothetical protein [Euryarchaeota archaeon]
MINIRNLFVLNKATKAFLGTFFFLFLFGLIVARVDLAPAVFPLSISIGLLIGILYLYGVGRLEIHKGKEKYKMKDTPFSKKVSLSIKLYCFTCATVFFIGYGMIVVEDYSLRSLGVMLTAMGTLITFSFFTSTGRLNIYKEDYSKEKKKDKKEHSNDD